MDRASQIKGKVTKEQNHFVMWAIVMLKAATGFEPETSIPAWPMTVSAPV